MIYINTKTQDNHISQFNHDVWKFPKSLIIRSTQTKLFKISYRISSLEGLKFYGFSSASFIALLSIFC